MAQYRPVSIGSGQESTIIDPIGATSRLTAAARARENLRTDPLFLDPWADALAGAEGFAAFDRHNAARAVGGEFVENPTFAIRTRFFDDLLLAEARERNVRQIVIVAAGLDTRAFRLQWPPETDLYELDQPQVLAYKNEIVPADTADPTCRRHVVGVDLRQPWVPALCTAGFSRDRPSVWLAEGLTFYLDEAAVRRLFTDVAGIAAAGDTLGVDFVSVAPPDVGPLVRFTTDDATGLLRVCGWDSERMFYDLEGERLGRRWPYPGRPNGYIAVARRAP
jgi:methyltransferase (TIGR00027 family)